MMDDLSDAARQRREARRKPAHYDRDLYRWAVEQAALLRAGRISEADALNIAEEIDDVGKELYFRLESALRVILLHLLKWDHQPERRSLSWWASVTEHRNRVRRLLEKNPGLKPRLAEAIRGATKTPACGRRRKQSSTPEFFPSNVHILLRRPWSGQSTGRQSEFFQRHPVRAPRHGGAGHAQSPAGHSVTPPLAAERHWSRGVL
jgi:hypothetical protein